MRSARNALPIVSEAPKARWVFINCPFDDDYRPILRAICFTIMACGYVPRCALDFNDSGAVRLSEIIKLISQCRRSVHDISRVELDPISGLPRFNMPLELGADLGLKLAGPAAQRDRRILVLDAEKHRYDVTLSDISGMDIKAHGQAIDRVIAHVRGWLNANRGDQPILPGARALLADYRGFLEIAPDIIEELRLDPQDALPHGDYVYVVERALPKIEKTRCWPN